jgi:hypothetical protein
VQVDSQRSHAAALEAQARNAELLRQLQVEQMAVEATAQDLAGLQVGAALPPPRGTWPCKACCKCLPAALRSLTDVLRYLSAALQSQLGTTQQACEELQAQLEEQADVAAAEQQALAQQVVVAEAQADALRQQLIQAEQQAAALTEALAQRAAGEAAAQQALELRTQQAAEGQRAAAALAEALAMTKVQCARAPPPSGCMAYTASGRGQLGCVNWAPPVFGGALSPWPQAVAERLLAQVAAQQGQLYALSAASVEQTAQWEVQRAQDEAQLQGLGRELLAAYTQVCGRT